MSYNNTPETAHQFLKRTTTILNIDTRETHVIDMLIEEIRTVNDPFAFYEYIKANQNTLGTNYKTGYQKFTFLLDQFKRNQISLDDDELESCDSYVNKLFSKVAYVFDDLSWRVQSSSFDLNSDQVTRFIQANFNKEEMLVLNKIGDRKRLLQRNKQKQILKNEIEQIVMGLLTNKKKQQLGYVNQNSLINPKIKHLIGK